MGVEESRSEAGLDRSRPASARSPQRDSVETVTTPPARLRLPISPALANTSKWRVTAIREIGKVAAIWTVMAGRARNRPGGANGPGSAGAPPQRRRPGHQRPGALQEGSRYVMSELRNGSITHLARGAQEAGPPRHRVGRRAFTAVGGAAGAG